MQGFFEIIKQYESVIVAFCSLITAASAFFAYWKWRNEVNLRRSIRFQELVSKNRIDQEMRAEIYKLDDDTNKWLDKDFYGSDEEKILDKVLFYFSYEIYLYNHSYIKKEEFQLVSYEINRALINPQLQEYLFNLQMYAKCKGIQSPYKYLIKYGLRRGLLDTSFSFRFMTSMKKGSKFQSYYGEWLKDERLMGKERCSQLDSCNCVPRSIWGRTRDYARSVLFSLKWFF